MHGIGIVAAKFVNRGVSSRRELKVPLSHFPLSFRYYITPAQCAYTCIVPNRSESPCRVAGDHAVICHLNPSTFFFPALTAFPAFVPFLFICTFIINTRFYATSTMMEPTPSLQSDGPPYPSFEELQRKGHRVMFTRDTWRLYWELDGDFPGAISVMKTRKGANDLEPFFRPDTATWHELAGMPLTEPKVSSVEAMVSDLRQWESDWLEWHDWHEAPEYNQVLVAYGDLDNNVRPYAGEPPEDDEDTKFLIKCCGEDRPLRKKEIKLKVMASAGGDSFVTVRDYVSCKRPVPITSKRFSKFSNHRTLAVHPWLKSLRSEIMKAKEVARPLAYNTKLPYEWMVDVFEGPFNKIEEKKDWVQSHGGGPRREHPLPVVLLEHLAQKRAERELRNKSN